MVSILDGLKNKIAQTPNAINGHIVAVLINKSLSMLDGEFSGLVGIQPRKNVSLEASVGGYGSSGNP